MRHEGLQRLFVRRFTSDLRTAYGDGLVACTPHFNSVSNYLTDAALTPLLKELITLSSLSLKAVEKDFAVDSSGFGTCRFVRWYDKKYGREVEAHEWVKVHLMTGVQTNVVTSAEVSGWAANDSPYFTPLVKTTARHFQIDEVSADKAYLSHGNLALVEGVGGTPFIPFKVNTVVPADTSVWGRMYHLFAYNRQDFLAHYHKRSNVETTFSMIKGKFGDSVCSKSITGQITEALCKVLCHSRGRRPIRPVRRVDCSCDYRGFSQEAVVRDGDTHGRIHGDTRAWHSRVSASSTRSLWTSCGAWPTAPGLVAGATNPPCEDQQPH